MAIRWRFQSTAPVWGPTTVCHLLCPGDVHFNPRPPCGGRPQQVEKLLYELKFQSTAPVWGPTICARMPIWGVAFQSTAPVWGPTSIALTEAKLPLPFQSTAPVWGPTQFFDCVYAMRKFQSTAPVWGPTLLYYVLVRIFSISIHGPRVGADVEKLVEDGSFTHFNPRPPCGGRRLLFLMPVLLQNFNPRPPCGGRRSATQALAQLLYHFNPRPPCGGRPVPSDVPVDPDVFQSTAPVWGPTRSV